MYVTNEELSEEFDRRSRQREHIRASYLCAVARALEDAELAQAELEEALVRAKAKLQKLSLWCVGESGC